MLARFNEVVCLQKVDHPVLDDGLKDFSWDGSQADGSVIPRVRQETLLGMGKRPQTESLGDRTQDLEMHVVCAC